MCLRSEYFLNQCSVFELHLSLAMELNGRHNLSNFLNIEHTKYLIDKEMLYQTFFGCLLGLFLNFTYLFIYFYEGHNGL